MSHYQQHREFFDKPIRLTEKEKEAPLGVIEEFFTDYRLSEIRELNEQVSHICLTADMPPFDDPEQRDRLLNFRDYQERLMEASLILLNTKPKADESSMVGPNQVEAPKVTKASDITSFDLESLFKRLVNLQCELSVIVATVQAAWTEKFRNAVNSPKQ